MDEKRYGANGDPNLPAINEVVTQELYGLANDLGPGFSVSGICPLELTPQKGYTAKGTANLSYDGRPFGGGQLTTILFQPRDGTGSKDGFNPRFVALFPKETPRVKEGYAELFLPLGTIRGEEWKPGITCLSAERPVDEGEEHPTRSMRPTTPYEYLTHSIGEFRDAMNILLREDYDRVERRFKFTLDRGARDRRKRGGEHAIVWDHDEYFSQGYPCYPQTFFQVGAFLPIPGANEDYEIAKELVGAQEEQEEQEEIAAIV